VASIGFTLQEMKTVGCI